MLNQTCYFYRYNEVAGTRNTPDHLYREFSYMLKIVNNNMCSALFSNL